LDYPYSINNPDDSANTDTKVYTRHLVISFSYSYGEQIYIT